MIQALFAYQFQKNTRNNEKKFITQPDNIFLITFNYLCVFRIFNEVYKI